MSTAADHAFMTEAVALAREGLFTTAPNPRVGCVIVRAGAIIGRGFHARAGGPHAEVVALRDAGSDVAGATAYVTLEPCSHHGRTPPCADALVAAGLARVVVAHEDPNPLVAGKGIAHLRAAGIRVDSGVCADAARALNPGFCKRMLSGLPWVRVKLAMSLDGRTAMASGESQWITGADARADVQALRARSCAVLTGIGTVLADDPRLDVRLPGASRQPVRVVVDSALRLPPDARIVGMPGELVVATCSSDGARREQLAAAGVTVMTVPAHAGHVDLRQLLERLADAQCNEVLIEAGATLAGAALAQGLVDELVVYMAPVLLGSDARPLLDLPLARMSERVPLAISEIVPVGVDWRITARPAGTSPAGAPEGATDPDP